MAAMILVIEDEESTRDLLQRSLSKAGYEIVAAPDGKSALKILANSRPDLILLDLMLPDIPGMEILKHVTTQPNPPAVVIFSARSDAADIEAATRAGAFKFLVKPISRDKLLETIKLALTPRAKPYSQP
jgi:two-component system KDP operon response regulator KdpE